MRPWFVAGLAACTLAGAGPALAGDPTQPSAAPTGHQPRVLHPQRQLGRRTGHHRRTDHRPPARGDDRFRSGQLADRARRDLHPVEPDRRPRPDPGPPADGRHPHPGRAHRLRQQGHRSPGGTGHRPDRSRPRGRGRQRRLLRHRAHRRSPRPRQGPPARPAARAPGRLEQRVLHRQARQARDHRPAHARADPAPPRDRRHQPELAVRHARRHRDLHQGLGPDRGVRRHPGPARAGPLRLAPRTASWSARAPSSRRTSRSPAPC